MLLVSILQLIQICPLVLFISDVNRKWSIWRSIVLFFLLSTVTL